MRPGSREQTCGWPCGQSGFVLAVKTTEIERLASEEAIDAVCQDSRAFRPHVDKDFAALWKSRFSHAILKPFIADVDNHFPVTCCY